MSEWAEWAGALLGQAERMVLGRADLSFLNWFMSFEPSLSYKAFSFTVLMF